MKLLITQYNIGNTNKRILLMKYSWLCILLKFFKSRDCYRHRIPESYMIKQQIFCINIYLTNLYNKK